MKGVVRLLSSICRQFLIGLARLGRGSSRESVSTPIESSRSPARNHEQNDGAAIAAPDPSPVSPSGDGRVPKTGATSPAPRGS